MLVHEGFQLFELALADVRRSLDAGERLREARSGVCPGGVRQEFQFVEAVAEIIGRRVWRLDANENGGFAFVRRGECQAVRARGANQSEEALQDRVGG